MEGRSGLTYSETTAALNYHSSCPSNKTPKIVFGSFTEEESKLLQPALPPAIGAVKAPLFGVDDFPELGRFHFSDPTTSAPREPSRRNDGALLPNGKAGWAGILGRAPAAATSWSSQTRKGEKKQVPRSVAKVKLAPGDMSTATYS